MQLRVASWIAISFVQSYTQTPCESVLSLTICVLHFRAANRRPSSEDRLLALAQHGEPEPINIGTGQEISVAALAQAVATATGFSGTIRFDSSKPDGQPRKVMDCSLAAERLGWRAETDLEAGLAQTVAWYREQFGC